MRAVGPGAEPRNERAAAHTSGMKITTRTLDFTSNSSELAVFQPNTFRAYSITATCGERGDIMRALEANPQASRPQLKGALGTKHQEGSMRQHGAASGALGRSIMRGGWSGQVRNRACLETQGYPKVRHRIRSRPARRQYLAFHSTNLRKDCAAQPPGADSGSGPGSLSGPQGGTHAHPGCQHAPQNRQAPRFHLQP